MLREIYSIVPFKQNIFEFVRRLVCLPEATYRHMHFTGVFEIAIDPGHTFKIRHYGYQVENDLFWAGFGNGWEGTSLRLWVRLARQARTIFDVGANTGVYALAAKTVNPSAQVFAFEPVTRIAARLCDNVALNSYDITVEVTGISANTGEAVIYCTPTAHAYSASLNPETLAGRDDLVESRIAITRMDEFATSRNLVSTDLFKIDLSRWSALRDYRARVAALPFVAAVLEREGLTG